jgi:hypothetical protein
MKRIAFAAIVVVALACQHAQAQQKSVWPNQQPVMMAVTLFYAMNNYATPYPVYPGYGGGQPSQPIIIQGGGDRPSNPIIIQGGGGPSQPIYNLPPSAGQYPIYPGYGSPGQPIYTPPGYPSQPIYTPPFPSQPIYNPGVPTQPIWPGYTQPITLPSNNGCGPGGCYPQQQPMGNVPFSQAQPTSPQLMPAVSYQRYTKWQSK